MAGLIDMPTSWEPVGATQSIVMQDERNFERSTPDWAATFPRDMSLADDNTGCPKEGGSGFICEVQRFMKGGPLGTFKYLGAIDGIITDQLIYTVIQFGWKLRDKTGKNIRIVSGKTISSAKWLEAMELLRSKDKKEKKRDLGSGRSAYASFQKYFKDNGAYSGSLDGNPNALELKELGTAAKKLESSMATAVSNNEIIGKLWDDGSKTFLTSLSDLQMALKTIVEHKKKDGDGEKSLSMSKNDRFLVLSYLNARKF